MLGGLKEINRQRYAGWTIQLHIIPFNLMLTNLCAYAEYRGQATDHATDGSRTFDTLRGAGGVKRTPKSISTPCIGNKPTGIHISVPNMPLDYIQYGYTLVHEMGHTIQGPENEPFYALTPSQGQRVLVFITHARTIPRLNGSAGFWITRAKLWRSISLSRRPPILAIRGRLTTPMTRCARRLGSSRTVWVCTICLRRFSNDLTPLAGQSNTPPREHLRSASADAFPWSLATARQTPRRRDLRGGFAPIMKRRIASDGTGPHWSNPWRNQP